MKKILFILFIISNLLFAQRNAVFSQNSVLGDSITTETYTLNEVVTDSVLLYLLTGYMPIKVDTISATDNITLQPNQEKLSNSNKWFTNLGDWQKIGGMDATRQSDSSVLLSNIPVELNPNPTFGNWNYVDYYNADFSSGVDSWTSVKMTTSGNIDAVSDGSTSKDNTLRATITNETGGHYVGRSTAITVGSTSKIILKYYIPNSNTQIDGFIIWLNTSGTLFYDARSNSGTPAVIGRWTTIELIASNITTNILRIYFYDGATESYTGNGTDIVYLNELQTYPLIAPTGWTSATMTATDYVLENTNGIQFKEVTGTTSISLAGLVNGATYQVVNNLYSRTSGELNVYNGSTETAFSTSLGLDTVQVTMVGTTLTLQVDNNTDLVSSMISIKRVYPENYIYLPVTTDPDYLHTISFNAKSDSANTKVYYSYGSIVDSSEVLTATDTLLSINGYGQGADSLKILATDNSEITISEPSIIKLNDNFIVTKDSTEYLSFTPRTDSLGSYSETITVNNTVVNVNWEIVNPPQIIAMNDTLFFNNGDTINALTTATLKFYNPSPINEYVLIDYTYTPSLLPFASINENSLASPGDTASYVFSINPIVDSLYQKTIRFVAIDGGFNNIDTVDVVFYANVNVPDEVDTTTLATPVLAITDTTGEMYLTWDNIDNALGYRVYRDSELIETVTTNSYTETINPFYEVDYYVIAFNDYYTSQSNTVSRTMIPNGVQGTNYYLISAVDGSANFDNIAQTNAGLSVNKFAYFKSAEQFDDAILAPKQNQTYGTYGGAASAIIGDSNSTSFTNTINIAYTDIVLGDLKIYGYKNATTIITYSDFGFTINNCEIIGGENAHSVATVGIKSLANGTTSDPMTTITNNIIHSMTVGIYINRPYNVEIAYNEMYNFWIYGGHANVGGRAMTFHTNGLTDTWDANYTLHIHHNDISEFEYTAVGAWVSRTLFEYNEVHHNLDERIFRGGVKHGSVGKAYDNTSTTLGCLGNILRYNYIHDLKKFGENNKTYGEATIVLIDARDWTETSNSLGYPVYELSDAEGDGSFALQPDAIISGLGYGNIYIHNNLFQNISQQIFARGYSRESGSGATVTYRTDLPSYFVNNTIINSGESYWTRSNGFVQISAESQSPTYITNNIFDYVNSSPYAVIKGAETGTNGYNVDYNIYLNNSGVATRTSIPSDKALWQQYGTNSYSGLGEQYNTLPNWVDTTATFLASNIGDDGAYLPNARLVQDGNAYDNGMAYISDPLDTTLAYDMLGNLRATNDIGAFGIPVSEDLPSAPSVRVVTQPTDQSVNETETATFTILGTTDNTGNVGYQWWRSPYVSDAVSRIIDGGKFSGATTNTLTITNVSTTEASDDYVCEVKNLNDYPNTYVNSNIVDLAVVTGSAIQDSIEVVTGSGRDDAYWYSSASYNISNSYINVGNVASSNNAFLRFRSVSIPDGAVADSAFITINAYFPLTTTTVNLIVYGEDSATPLQFDIPTDAEARTLTTASTTLNNVGWSTNAVDYTIDVTDIINELLTSYDYSLGDIAFQIRDNSSSSGAYRRFRAGESGVYPKLKVYYTE